MRKECVLRSLISKWWPIDLTSLIHRRCAVCREWSKHNKKNLPKVIRCFHVASGLKVNFNKSQVLGVGANMQEI